MMNPGRSALALMLPVLTTLAGSCAGAGGQEFSAYATLPEEGWAYGDTVVFVPDSQTVGTPLRVAVSHNPDYPWRWLWLEVSDFSAVDTVRIEIADTFGTSLGSGLGMDRQTSAPISLLPRPGQPLNIRHIMRVDTLRGIERIGIVP